ncbi:MAG: ATP-binding cassette domain-containing protein, partial [Firmicutes bacterium]|nr:ATP-binding cassette domain-containing protein [Bacillota bacterium]
MSDTILRVEHLSVDYKIKAGWLSAVNDVSFSIDRGKVLALVGESGCGKSTVAHTIMRLSIDHNERIGGNIFFE